ncbi:MAG TPA: lipid-A-disaccharide synthase [Alphaproteobacteria bacterium]|nr:lipid-A-disaccharide synthase [Alphaproteobacteria bacterium]
MPIKKVYLLKEFNNKKLSQDKKFKIFIMAGELSGDILGEGLINQLKKLSQNKIEIYGVGGAKMIAQGLKPIFNIKSLSIMGIFEVLLKIPSILMLLKLAKNKIIEINPDIVITIDAPGFNLRLQNSIKDLKIKQIHYVAPSVWAWKSYRAKKIAKFLDHLLVLFPFEKNLFLKEGLNTTFVGHPIAFDNKFINNKYYTEKSLNNKAITKIAMLPGSRLGEIEKLMPVFIKSAILLNKDYKSIKFYVVTLKEYRNKIQGYFAKTNLDYYVTDNHEEKYNIYSKVNFVLCASGTVTMEVAKASTAMLVVYKLNFITWLIVRAMVKIKTATILNIISKDNIIPELFQKEVNETNIHGIIKKYIENSTLRNKQINKLNIAVNKLKNGDTNPSYIAAKSVLNYLYKNKY